jgi:hypothetical protein
MPLPDIQRSHLLWAGRVLILLLALAVVWFEFRPPMEATAAVASARPSDGPGRYSPEEIAFVMELAFGSQYGHALAAVRKWEEDVAIQVEGSPTPRDLEVLEATAADLSEIMGGLEVSLVEEGGNVRVLIVPSTEFAEHEPEYVRGNEAFFWCRWSGSRALTEARILIPSDEPDQARRSHLIRQYLSRSMGLMKLSGRHPESVFYSGDAPGAPGFAEVDRKAIEMFYAEEIRPGMTRRTARAILEGL